MSNDATSKSGRVLELYRMLLAGKTINKQSVAEHYGVNVRSIQRDIDSIRDFLSDQSTQQGVIQSVEYDVKEKGYRLVTQDLSNLSNGEMLAVCKILIESRVFTKKELTSLLNRILNLVVSQKDKTQIDEYVANEIFHYIDPVHPALSTEQLWEIAQSIKRQQVMEVTYCRLKGRETVTRRMWPVGIMFSEYYFYLMAFIDNPEKKKEFEKKDDPFPTIYRIDRLKEVRVLEETFSIPYNDRFKEGEYKNRTHFMYGGELQQVEFKYYGPSIEAVLDRLPTAKVVKKVDGSYMVKAEIFGKGILMWLLSQGSKVEVLAPESLRVAWIKELDEARNRVD